MASGGMIDDADYDEPGTIKLGGEFGFQIVPPGAGWESERVTSTTARLFWGLPAEAAMGAVDPSQMFEWATADTTPIPVVNAADEDPWARVPGIQEGSVTIEGYLDVPTLSPLVQVGSTVLVDGERYRVLEIAADGTWTVGLESLLSLGPEPT